MKTRAVYTAASISLILATGAQDHWNMESALTLSVGVMLLLSLGRWMPDSKRRGACGIGKGDGFIGMR